jgi:peroxiredoxin
MLTSIHGRRSLIALLLSLASLSVFAKEVFLRPWPAALATPSLKLSDLDGKEWNLQDLHGKVVVLNFWATWCENCIEEMQFFNQVAAGGNKKDKPVVLSVNYKEPATTVRSFATGRQFDYPILMDKSGDVFKQWAQGILPTTVLIDRKGRARWRIVGALDADDGSFRQTLEKLLKE